MRAVFDKILKPVYVLLRSRLTDVLFEHPTGIRTSTEVGLEELGLAAEHRSGYKPSGWLSLRRVLRRREVRPTDVFLDLGSGMGRVVIQAARYPFRRVLGVELSPQLHRIAVDNVRRSVPGHRLGDVELVNCDVLDYAVPDDVTVAYFANPFTGRIFAAALDNLLSSLERNPRTLRLIYFNPVEERMILERGGQPVRTVRGMRPSREWSRSNSIRMYRLERPAGVSGHGAGGPTRDR